jgi:hypothetical protein
VEAWSLLSYLSWRENDIDHIQSEHSSYKALLVDIVERGKQGEEPEDSSAKAAQLLADFKVIFFKKNLFFSFLYHGL